MTLAHQASPPHAPAARATPRERGAGCRPAVSPTASRPGSRARDGCPEQHQRPLPPRALAGWQPAIRQAGSLRYRLLGAFTLIELLVVIAVIAILAALLLPALSKAKASAKRAECLTRQKQWAIGFHLYADDNEGWLPREGYHNTGEVYINNWSQVQNPASQDVWYNAIAIEISRRPAASYARTEDHPAFYDRNSFFHCPSVPPIKGIRSGTAFFSMAMNSQLVDPPNVPKVKLGLIRDPVRTVLLLDNLLDEEPPVVEEQAKDNLGQPAAYANRFAGKRHGRSGIITFVDGHAEAVSGNKVVETQGDNAGWAILPPVQIFWETE